MPQINKPSDYFNTKLYTGNGTDATSITGVGFQPDWVWVKERSSTSSHKIADSVRGATKELESNNTGAEGTNSTGLQSFDSDGFTLGTSVAWNENTQTYASWNWLASNTTASNTDGSITSTVSANTTSGFSIVSYTGTGVNATVGHGLGVAPSMIIVKRRSGDPGDWRCYHKSLGETYLIRLNLTNAALVNPSWNDTAPTSSVFSIGTNGDVNTSGGNHIAYCFAEKKGFSKFGSYVGNGSTDGTFVYTGFKPAFVIVKRASGVDNWLMWDNKRNTSNATVNTLRPNTSEVENTSAYPIDFLSNGFKNRGISGHHNTSGETYIYMCFAENPLTGTNGVPCTAR